MLVNSQSLRSRGINMLVKGMPSETIARQLGVTLSAVGLWRRRAIKQEQRKLWDGVHAVSLLPPKRKRAKFLDKHKPSDVNGPAIWINGTFIRGVLQ